MVNRPSVPEIITVNSEALQTQIRDLLPSQNGFGSELQASNVITPIIDLTAAAEGSGLPDYLQTALAFSSQTAFSASNSTVVLANSPGFYRIFGNLTARTQTAAGTSASFTMTDGLSVKSIWIASIASTADVSSYTTNFDFNVFLRAGDSISAVSSNSSSALQGSFRQIATGDGTLVQPVGFPL